MFQKMEKFVIRTLKFVNNCDNDQEKENSPCSKNQIFQSLQEQTPESEEPLIPKSDKRISSDKGWYIHTSTLPSIKFVSILYNKFVLDVTVTTTTSIAAYQRKFLPLWKETYKWLSFNELKNKAFCEVCREAFDKIKILLPKSGSNDDKVYEAFVKDGYDGWKNAISRFKSHEKTEVHRKNPAFLQ